MVRVDVGKLRRSETPTHGNGVVKPSKSTEADFVVRRRAEVVNTNADYRALSVSDVEQTDRNSAQPALASVGHTEMISNISFDAPAADTGAADCLLAGEDTEVISVDLPSTAVASTEANSYVRRESQSIVTRFG